MASSPPTSDAWHAAYTTGLTAAAQGSWPEACAAWSEACALEPTYGPGHEHLGDALLKMGAHQAALEALQKAVQAGHDTSEVHHRLGRACMGLANLKAGLQHLRRAAALKPGYAPTWACLAQVHSQLGQQQQAEAAAVVWTALAPEQFEAHFAVGRARTAQDAWLPAAAAFAAAARIDAQSLQAALGLAVSLTNGEAWTQALEAWARYVRLDPEAQGRAALSQGVCHLALDAFETAERAFAQAILADSQKADAYFSSGTAQLYQSKWDAARVSYQAGLALRPHDVGAQVHLGMALVELGQFEAAARTLLSVEASERYDRVKDTFLLRAQRGLGDDIAAAQTQARLDACR